ncbi:MAG: hypothetical protein KFW09_02910 [Oscillospiraceae bacterium]|nr:hypothetical protein [Oscillospiraceae bacterium]
MENKIDTIIKTKDKLSEYNLFNKTFFIKLSYSKDYLVPCSIEIEEDYLNFEYNIQNLKCLASSKIEEKLNKIKVILNVIKSLNNMNEFSVILNPQNIFFDIDFNIKFLKRDFVKGFKENKESVYTDQVKSLMGYLLQNKYTYDDYLYGGLDILNKDKFLSRINRLDNINLIYEELFVEYKTLVLYKTEKTININKKSFYLYKRMSIFVSFLFVISCGYIIYESGYRLPLKNMIITANNNYIHKDYGQVIDDLSNISLSEMDRDTKYFLCVSYINLENLADNQKNNILSNIILNSDEKFFEFWIYLGKGLYDEAIGIGKQLGDNQYTLYSYMKKKIYIEGDLNIKGEEKEAILKEIDEEIKNIDQKIREETPK